MSAASRPLSLPVYKGSTVRVSPLFVGNMSFPTSLILQSPIAGHETVDLPLYSFLVENEKADKKVLFDLGLTKAWKEKYPYILAMAQGVNATFDIPADVPEILTSASIPLASIDSIIWSYHHVEHIGDPSLFPHSTSLVVGPGFKAGPCMYPGFPTNPDGHPRHLRAIDWFDDGSLYLLEAPGRSPEHIMALARTSTDKFVLLAGDAVEHPGVLRPNALLPLPETIAPSGSLLERVHPSPSSFRTTPYYKPTAASMPDYDAGTATLEKLQAFDACPDVLVVIAHDPSLRDPSMHFPAASFARWEEPQGAGKDNRKDAAHWHFLRDFQKGVVE